MKKIIISFLILALLVPALVFSAELEKIPTPEQIKLFKVMKKEGNTLYGIKLKAEEKVKEAVKNASETSGVSVQGAVSNLEKIAGPWDVKLFEKIKQVGNALWGYRKQEEEHLGIDQLTPEVIVCLKTAIDKKDTAVKKTIIVASDELVAAIDGRNTCQKAALDLSSNQERMKAWKICKEIFQKAVNESRHNAKKYRDEAWKIYQQEVRACYQQGITSAIVDSDKPVACTTEAKVCSDGSVVSRTGTNCEFAPCPGEKSADSTSSSVKSSDGNLLLEDGGDMLDL